jgi:hypothetical protein
MRAFSAEPEVNLCVISVSVMFEWESIILEIPQTLRVLLHHESVCVFMHVCMPLSLSLIVQDLNFVWEPLQYFLYYPRKNKVFCE